MRGLTLPLVLLAALLAVMVVPAGSTAARKTAKKPQVTSVSPMRVKVGRTLTIRGRNFSSNRRRNTVIFAVGRRSLFAKPSRASRRRLVVKVPVSVERLMRRDGEGARRPTRFTLQVAARKFSRRTPRRLSPVILPLSTARITFPGPAGGSGPPPPSNDCDDDGTPDNSDASSDVDLLSDSLERSLKTDPCDADTDGDGAEDGYEHQAALDLNHYPRTAPLPYPGKRPYPNALDPNDGSTDYDGDALTLREEHLLWQRFSTDGVRRSGHPTTLASLLYSDGLQKSIDPAPLAPAAPLDNWASDQDEDGRLTDDERDADADRLNNWDESHGQLVETWWPARHDGTIEPKESKYPGIDFIDNEDLPGRDALADRDIDGDTVPDGDDDADHDGLSNQFEVRRPDDWQADAAGANPWAYVNPFNPCKPFDSERCHRYVPFGYYASDDVPPIGPPVPAGYPGSRPATPDG